MTTVADAPVTVAYLLGQASANECRALLDHVHAPALIDVEATQTLRGLLRASKIDVERAEQAREDLADLAIWRHPDANLLRRAWELRDVCTTYDALYVALAEALDAPLVTRDARLARGVDRIIEVSLGA